MSLNRLLMSFVFVLASATVAPTASAWNWQTDACRTATAGSAQWQNAPLIPMYEPYTSQPQHMSISFTANPQSETGDMLFGVSQGPQTNWRGIAAIVRFNQNGTIDVRDGDVYRADTVMQYGQPGTWGDYLVRMEIDLAAHTYSVYISENFNWTSYRNERLLAHNYRFRTEQQAVSRLDNFVVEAEIGSLHACQQSNHPYLVATPGSAQWQNASTFYELKGSQSLSWFATPTSANSDALLALSYGRQTTWSGLAAIVRFNSTGTIDVRNGDRYMADAIVAYVPGKKYLIDIYPFIAYDGSTRFYSVDVTPEGGERQRIATRYAFRTEQQGVPSLNNWVVEAETGGLKAAFVYGDAN